MPTRLTEVVTVRLDRETWSILSGEGTVAEPSRSVADTIRHVLRVHAAQVEAWLAGETPRPTTMLPRGDFDDFIEHRNRERAEYIRKGGPRLPKNVRSIPRDKAPA